MCRCSSPRRIPRSIASFASRSPAFSCVGAILFRSKESKRWRAELSSRCFSSRKIFEMKFSLFPILLVQFLAVGDSISAQSSLASFAYVLQADSLAKSKAEAVTKLAACGRDWIVLDANFSSDEPWTAADLAAIRAGRAGRKVIAYISIGEAEDYRASWQRAWDADRDGQPDAGAPAFLLAQNPEWKGNYRVKYRS